MIVDITRILGRTLKGYYLSGIDRVCIEYLAQFKGYVKTSIFLCNNLFIINPHFSQIIIDKLLFRDSNGLIKLLPAFPFNLCRSEEKEIFINLSHSGGLDSTDYIKKLRRKKLNIVFMVHDLIPIEHPELVREGEKERHKIRVKNFINADCIIANSKQTKLKLIRYAKEKYHKDIERKIEVNYLGISSQLFNMPEIDFNHIKEKYNLNKRYFVVLSTIEPRKNHLILLYAWKNIHSILKEQTPLLVLIGRRGWDIEQVIDFIERSRISPFIREINNCPDSDLKSILKNSQALLMPSIDEGFGLPVLESIMLDVLTVCSNLSIFSELFKDIPIYCSWADASDWTNVIMGIFKDKEKYLNLQKQKLQKNRGHIEQYTWQMHFKRLKDIFQKNGLFESDNIYFRKENNFAIEW